MIELGSGSGSGVSVGRFEGCRVVALLMKGLGLRSELMVEAGALGGPLVDKAQIHEDLHFYKA